MNTRLIPPLSACLALLFAAGGCTIFPGTRVPARPAAIAAEEEPDLAEALQLEVHEIGPELLRRQRMARMKPEAPRHPPRRELGGSYEYRIGRGDVLTVIVWNHPELTNPMGTIRETEGLGRLVRDDGTIFFPFAGTVQAVGRSPEEVRVDITERLRPYVENPQVDVRVTTFRSQRVYVTGEVAQPGVLYVDDRPLTILDAIGRAGGFTPEADQRLARLTRDGGERVIDLFKLYATGAEDEVLQDGDVLHIPDDAFNQVFVMGEVGSQRAIPMRRGRLSLAEAITGAEGYAPGTADARRIIVIRGKPVYDDSGVFQGVQPIVYQLDGRQAAALVLAEAFELEPRDIVFIPPTNLVRWNRVVAQILPTVQTIWMTDRLIRD
jgi:polysaccharide biosynthesis/export protein